MKIGMLFSGYGSQYVGMGKELYDDLRVIQEYFEEASNCASINFVKLCFASSDAEISQLQNANLAIFLTQSSAAQAIKDLGINIDKIAGYGIGELSAIHTAKAISLPDALYLISKITQFYLEFISTLDLKILLVKNITLKDLKLIIKNLSENNNINIYITAINSEKEFLIALDSKDFEQTANSLKEAGAKNKILTLDYGLFCKLAEPIVANIKLYLAKIDLKDPILPIIFTQSAKTVRSSKEIKKHIIDYVVSPILWTKTLEQFVDCDIIIIPTPGKELAEKVKEIYPEKNIVYIGKTEDLNILKELIKENKIQEQDNINQDN